MRTNVIHRQERGSTQLALKASVPLLRIRITRVRIGVKGHLRERIRRRKWIHLVAESKRIFHWRRYVRGIKMGRSDQQYGRPQSPVVLRHLSNGCPIIGEHSKRGANRGFVVETISDPKPGLEVAVVIMKDCLTRGDHDVRRQCTSWNARCLTQRVARA